MHEITTGHWSLSGTISCVTNRIHFLPVTMTGRCSKFNSISYKEDRHKLRVISRKYRLPDTMSRISKIFISGAALINVRCFFSIWRGLIFNKMFPCLTYCINKILQVIFSKTWLHCDLPRTLIRTSRSEDIKDYFSQVIFSIESGNVASRI